MDGLLLARPWTALLIAAGSTAGCPLLLVGVGLNEGFLFLDVLGLALGWLRGEVPLRWSLRMMMKGSSGRRSSGT